MKLNHLQRNRIEAGKALEHPLHHFRIGDGRRAAPEVDFVESNRLQRIPVGVDVPRQDFIIEGPDFRPVPGDLGLEDAIATFAVAEGCMNIEEVSPAIGDGEESTQGLHRGPRLHAVEPAPGGGHRGVARFAGLILQILDPELCHGG